jgi:hypothetical protein
VEGARIDSLEAQAAVAITLNGHSQTPEHGGEGLDVGELGHAVQLDRFVGQERGRHDRESRVLGAADLDNAFEPPPSLNPQATGAGTANSGRREGVFTLIPL